MRTAAAAASLFALWVALPGTGARDAAAQSANRAVEFEDIGLTDPGAVGARDCALRTPVLSGADVTAIAANAAGLARLKRIHATFTTDRESGRVELTYAATVPASDVTASRLAFAGVAVPLRVLRGSLVPALSVYRAFSSDLDLAYQRDNAGDGRSEHFRLEQDGATYAYALGVASDYSSVLSAGFSVFLLAGQVDTHRRYDWQPLVAAPAEQTFVLEDITSDVSGFGARLGVQVFPHRRLRLGLAFDTPRQVNVSSASVREETRQVDNDVGSFTRTTAELDTRYVLPYRLAGALGVSFSSLFVTLQADYIDWALATIDGHRIYTPDIDPVLERVIGVAAGVEWTPPGTALRVRAGFSHAPAPLRYLQADRIDNDEMRRVTSHSGPTRVSAGAAALLFRRVVVEASWEHGGGSRKSDVVSDDLSETTVSLAGSFYF